MKQLSEYLTELIVMAEDVMRRPAIKSHVPPAIGIVAHEIRRIDAQPAENLRCTRAGVAIVTAIEGFYASGNDRWQMVIGATLPLLRIEAWDALHNERAIAAESRR